MSDEQVLVGDVEAGRAAKVKREINKLISATNTNTFDIADLLFEVKSRNYFSDWGFESFSKYAKSLEIKYSKSYYLVKIVELMRGSDLARALYEPVGLGKLRVISRLDLAGEHNEVPMPMVIRELTLKAANMTLEEVQFAVDEIMGLTQDESMVWENFHLKKSARDNTVRPAIAKMIKFLPQTEEDGVQKDASKGAALEMICANFLADPNYDSEETTVGETDASGLEAELPESVAETDGLDPNEQI
jgi:hypothetical protein